METNLPLDVLSQTEQKSEESYQFVDWWLSAEWTNQRPKHWSRGAGPANWDRDVWSYMLSEKEINSSVVHNSFRKPCCHCATCMWQKICMLGAMETTSAVLTSRLPVVMKLLQTSNLQGPKSHHGAVLKQPPCLPEHLPQHRRTDAAAGHISPQIWTDADVHSKSNQKGQTVISCWWNTKDKSKLKWFGETIFHVLHIQLYQKKKTIE